MRQSKLNNITRKKAMWTIEITEEKVRKFKAYIKKVFCLKSMENNFNYVPNYRGYNDSVILFKVFYKP